MKRQLYVFQEYFKEQFILYKTELKRKLETDLKNKVLQEKAKIADDYEESFKKLKQMEALLQGKFENPICYIKWWLIQFLLSSSRSTRQTGKSHQKSLATESGVDAADGAQS